MVRLENWPIRLSAYLKETRRMPFQWGVNDCILFAAKAIEALTGENLYTPYLGYADEAGARDVLKAHGGLQKIVMKHLGPGHRNYLQAQRGDLVLMKLEQETIGIVDDSGQRVVCVGPAGMVRLPLERARRIWGY